MIPNAVLEGYLNRKWRIVPVYRPDPETRGCSCGRPKCPNPGKHPVGQFWPGGSTDLRHFLGRNVGVQLGPDSQNLADVDKDCREAVLASPFLLPRTDSAFGHGGRETHALYTVIDGTASFLKLQDPVLSGRDATIIELRWPEWDGAEHRYKAIQTVFPPSLQRSGDIIEWQRVGEPTGVTGADLGAAVRRVGAAVLIARYARPKERHALVLLLANLGVRAGWEDDLIVRFIIAVFTARNDADKVAKIQDGEGLGAVQDAKKRLASQKPMSGLPVLREMFDLALTGPDTDKLIARVKEWLAIPDSPGPQVASARGGEGGGSTRSAEPPAWEPPVPLLDLDLAPLFPIHLFPSKVADYWRAAAVALHVPVDYVAAPGLSILGAAIGRSRAAEVKPGYAESPLFWVAVIAPAGAAKSASLRAARTPLDREEAHWRVEYLAALQTFDSEAARFELEMKEWRKNPEGEPPIKPYRPTLRQSVLDDTTAEAAARVLRENGRGLVLAKDELIGLARMLNQYRGGRGNDKTFWLTGWNGRGAVKVNRSKDHEAGPLVIIDPFTAVGGMLCPDTLPELREEQQRGGAVADGWADRFLLSYPDPLDAVEETWAVVPEELEREYTAVVQALLNLEMVEVEEPGRDVTHRPYFVRFNPAAKSAWSDFTRDIAARVNALPKSDAYRGVLSKLKHYALRFACLFDSLDRVCGVATTEMIEAGCMTRAAELVWYFEAHGRRCLGVGDRATEPARRLLTTLAGWEADTFTKRELHRRVQGQTAFRRSKRLDAPLDLLTRHGYIAPEVQVGRGFGRPAERYDINPLWDRSSPDDNRDKTPPNPGNPGVASGTAGHGQKPLYSDKTPGRGASPVRGERAEATFGNAGRVLSMSPQDREHPENPSESTSFVNIVLDSGEFSGQFGWGLNN
jgi:hypothetical protein